MLSFCGGVRVRSHFRVQPNCSVEVVLCCHWGSDKNISNKNYNKNTCKVTGFGPHSNKLVKIYQTKFLPSMSNSRSNEVTRVFKDVLNLIIMMYFNKQEPA